MAAVCSQKMAVRNQIPNPLPSDSFGLRCEKYFSELNRWEVWRSIFLGQFLSVLLCTSAVISQLLYANYGVAAPTAQCFLNYVLLCLVFTTTLACRPGEGGLLSVLRKRGLKYFFLAIADVEANYLVVHAYQYTTLRSAQLLDCFAIPAVLVLSRTVLKVRYQIIHVIGVKVCLVGIFCLVWAIPDENNETAKDRLIGDLMCIGGALLYGIITIAEEYVVKTIDCVEFLAMIGLFGSVINGVQLAALEHEQVASIDWSEWRVIVLLAAFTLTLFTYYTITPTVMKITSAMAVNLSLLTADFYTLVIGVLLFQFKYDVMYALSYALVVAGVVIFCSRSAPIYSQTFGPRLTLPRTITTTTTTTNMSSHNSSHDMQFNMQSLSCPPPPPPPVVRSGMPAHTSISLPVYCHSAETTYGTYRRRRPGTAVKDSEEYYQVTRNPGLHGSQVEELTTSFDGRDSTPVPVNTRTGLESTPAPERMLLGGREPCPQPLPQQPLRPLPSLDSTFTQTVKLKLPPSPNLGGSGMMHSNRMQQLPHCTLPRSRGHKEVTFNPQATFQVYRRPSACYDGDEQL
ncbi:solute carrier family 35 member F2-like [Daphnia carinata]|uniref:solute carrier family 35 member F2-like n=1 Tax=Daphnia carinata TaxID=120202 RepID=UPI002868C853|nr:solute carrier family 35 member F2-like [Daphnia carinata]